MNHALRSKRDCFTPTGVAYTDTPEGLGKINAPDTAAVIWQRQPRAEFQTWINTLPPANLPEARIVLRPDRVLQAVTSICDQAATPDGPERTRLIDDIAALAQIFADTVGARYLRLRLDPVSTNACRKFHVDVITARLVCTYRGNGTQYGTSINDKDPTQIFTVPPGSPMVMRGLKWPEIPSSGLLHRSPPIEGSGETRLLLVLDPVSDPEEGM